MANTKIRDNNTNFLTDTDGLVIPTGTTAQRVANTGAIRFNSSLGALEFYNGSSWVVLDGKPTIASISPTAIAADGVTTTPVTITGTNFTSASTITLTSADGLNTITPSTTTYTSSTSIGFTLGATQISGIEGTGTATIAGVSISDTSGNFTCTSNSSIAAGEPVWITGSSFSSNYSMTGVAVTGVAGQFSCTSVSPQKLATGQTVTIVGQNQYNLSSVNIIGPDTNTITGVAITGTAGQFSCTSTTLLVGQAITITGTYGGTGSISGYASGTTYYVVATNGTPTGATTFTLSTTRNGTGVTTTAGTPTGLTYTKANTTGQIAFSRTTTNLAVGNIITISGTLGGTGTITGYTDPTTYYIIATDGANYATLSTTSGGSAVTTTAGTPTGLSYLYSGTGSITGNNSTTTASTTYYIIATNGSTTFTLSTSSGGSAVTTTAGTLLFGTNGSYTVGAGTSSVGSISGWSSGNVYYIIGSPTSTSFQLSATKGGSAITTTSGTPVGVSCVLSQYKTTKSPWNINVTSAGGNSSTLAAALATNEGPIFITPSGNISNNFSGNRSFSYQLQAVTETGSTSGITYSSASGTLPTGVTLSSSGLLSGTITAPGSLTVYTFSVTATDSTGLSTTQSMNIGVYPATVQTFNSSATFTVPTGLTVVDVLVVAGGGNGGGQCNIGGGGGAGGLIYRPAYPISPGTPIFVTVGPGGFPQGSPSTFGGLTAIGGGGGAFFAVHNVQTPQPGGSGGGGGQNSFQIPGSPGGTGVQPSQPMDSGSYGFGNPGGNSPMFNQGGGGGGAGGSGSPAPAGSGGAGKTYSISGSPVEYAAGGGGTVGGGAGGPSGGASGQAAAPGRGGGGGAQGAAGGSGVVIVKY
jgi:hypothetical protein